jgi:sigma-B regulation protein RsbU (phosphoserine phosphatase)
VVELVSKIDRHLLRFSAAHKFLTLFFGVVEPHTSLLRYVSAGHNPALLVRGSEEVVRLGATGFPVGLLPNGSWKEDTVPFGSGDLLCVYSDGFTEATNADEEEFGLERLEQTLVSRVSLPARDLSDDLFREVSLFAQGVPQYDDQTLLLVRRET